MKNIFTSLLLIMLLTGCDDILAPVAKTMPSDKSPHLLLISIDGFRWDYVDKYQPEFLTQFAQQSARLSSLRPSFPTKTFPNHLSIVTGSYPQNHGIVANHFYAPDINLSYSIKHANTVNNPQFYWRKPLWVMAEEQQIISASYFWPGSQTPINGITPTYFKQYNHSEPHQQKIDGILSWLRLPAHERPRLITTYFHDVDSAGHQYGQDSLELKQAITQVDTAIKTLVQQVRQLDMAINIVIVSDHGMSDYPASNYEYLPSWLQQQYNVKPSNPIVHIYKKDQTQQALVDSVKRLNQQAQHYQCYLYQDIPEYLNAANTNRMGDITCLADINWAIGFTGKVSAGDHGWDQFKTSKMDGIFYAQGPHFKSDYQLKTMENIHIMPLLAHILGIDITTTIDGDLQMMKPLLASD